MLTAQKLSLAQQLTAESASPVDKLVAVLVQYSHLFVPEESRFINHGGKKNNESKTLDESRRC